MRGHYAVGLRYGSHGGIAARSLCVNLSFLYLHGGIAVLNGSTLFFKGEGRREEGGESSAWSLCSGLPLSTAIPPCVA